MASPLRAAQRRTRPRYKRKIEGLKGERQGINQAFNKQADSLRGAGAAMESILGGAAAGLKQAGLSGAMLRQTQRDFGQLAASQDEGVSQMIASARMDRNDSLASVAKALEATRQSRQTAVRSEAEQIRGRRAARQEKRADAQAEAAQKDQKQARDHAKAVRAAIQEIRVKIGKEADAMYSPGQAGLADLLGMRPAESQLRKILRKDDGARRNFIDELTTSGNAANANVADQALELYLKRHALRARQNTYNPLQGLVGGR